MLKKLTDRTKWSHRGGGRYDQLTALLKLRTCLSPVLVVKIKILKQLKLKNNLERAVPSCQDLEEPLPGDKGYASGCPCHHWAADGRPLSRLQVESFDLLAVWQVPKQGIDLALQGTEGKNVRCWPGQSWELAHLLTCPLQSPRCLHFEECKSAPNVGKAWEELMAARDVLIRICQ